jgi:hypothetical protein
MRFNADLWMSGTGKRLARRRGAGGTGGSAARRLCDRALQGRVVTRRDVTRRWLGQCTAVEQRILRVL